MRRFVVSLAVVGLCSAVAAQDTASLNIPEVTPVVDLCATVAANQEAGDSSTDGQCVSAVEALLTDAQGEIGSQVALDETVADLVVRLAELAAADGVCNAFDTEIAEAIRAAAEFSSSPEQQAQIEEIAATVGDCEIGATAAINGPTGPASSISALQASIN